MSSGVAEIWCRGCRHLAVHLCYNIFQLRERMQEWIWIKHLVPCEDQGSFLNGCSPIKESDASTNHAVLISSASFPRDLTSRCSTWVMWSSRGFRLVTCLCLHTLACHPGPLVFWWQSAQSTLLCPACRKCISISWAHGDALSPFWFEFQTLCPSVPLNAGAAKLDFVPPFIRTKWKTGPSQCSCHLHKTDCVSVESLERVPMDLGTNDTSICWTAPPFWRWRGGSAGWVLLRCPVGDLRSLITTVKIHENTLFHPARCDMSSCTSHWKHSDTTAHCAWKCLDRAEASSS